MATPIVDGTLSREWTKFDPDSIWAAQALPNASDMTSAEFMAGYDQGKVGVQIEADTTVDIADGESLLIELIHDTSTGGDYLDAITLYDQTASGAAINFAVDEEIIAYIPEDVGPYCKLKITVSADESGDDINAYLRFLSN